MKEMLLQMQKRQSMLMEQSQIITKSGTLKIKVKASGNDDYNEAEKEFEVTINKGTLKLSENPGTTSINTEVNLGSMIILKNNKR